MTPEEIIKGKQTLRRFTHPNESFNFSPENKETEARLMSLFKYDTSLDALHPVWVKFRDLEFLGSGIKKQHQTHKESIEYSFMYEPIEIAFRDIVDAVNWYNECKEKYDLSLPVFKVDDYVKFPQTADKYAMGVFDEQGYIVGFDGDFVAIVELHDDIKIPVPVKYLREACEHRVTESGGLGKPSICCECGEEL